VFSAIDLIDRFDFEVLLHFLETFEVSFLTNRPPNCYYDRLGHKLGRLFVAGNLNNDISSHSSIFPTFLFSLLHHILSRRDLINLTTNLSHNNVVTSFVWTCCFANKNIDSVRRRHKLRKQLAIATPKIIFLKIIQFFQTFATRHVVVTIRILWN
jgi:hypothetical protein